ncbi:MAG: molybdopterin cofactor-binding domain-containing protein [Pseudomonadota bacterium]
MSARRDFLKTLGAGGLVVAIGPLGAQAALAASVVGWVRIGADGSATVLSNTSEIGQGTGTAIAQIMADELDLDWRNVRIELAPIEKKYFNEGWGEYATYGSGGIARQFDALRKAGAQARAMLIGAAARQWQVDPASCDTSAGAVVHAASKRKLAYGALAASAAAQSVPLDAKPMPRERWRHIGKETARLDLPPKVDGSAVYGIDTVIPGMLVATILQCPHFGGKLASVDHAPALALRGVRQVVQLDDAVAVVATSYWQAKKALAALRPQWNLERASKHNSDSYNATLRAAVEKGGTVYYGKTGPSAAERQQAYDSAAAKGAKVVEQVYSAPFLCHAPMEPMNATARVDADSAELWLPTQSQSNTQDHVAKLLGMKPEAVTIHTTLSGGGFGRRIEFDFALQAAQIARACKATVKLVWSREEDMKHDFFRPAVAMRLRANVDARGLPAALCIDSAGESLLQYSRMGADYEYARPVDSSALSRPPAYYNIPAVLARVNIVDAGVPVGYWRSVASSHNGFALESFVDELALAAGVDPLAYRRSMLGEGGRERKVLDAAVACAGQPGAGQQRGVALVAANGSVVAIVADLSVKGTAVKLHRISCAIDCGTVINPGSVRAQMEGGIAFALSATFYGEITLKDGAVEQSNFHDYRLLSLADLPPLEIVLVESSAAPGGAGEEAVGPVAPAIANALFAATGKRIRDLPLSRAGFTLA